MFFKHNRILIAIIKLAVEHSAEKASMWRQIVTHYKR